MFNPGKKPLFISILLKRLFNRKSCCFCHERSPLAVQVDITFIPAFQHETRKVATTEGWGFEKKATVYCEPTSKRKGTKDSKVEVGAIFGLVR